jgi:mono/diheme cytochrome c family protein
MRYVILLVVAALLVAAIGFFAWQGFYPSSPIPPDVPVQGLMPGQGRGLVLTHCGVCHSTALVASFRTSREGWDAVITRMQEEEGLWGFTTEDREAMLDYLAATQGLVGSGQLPERPWAQPLYPPNPIW